MWGAAQGEGTVAVIRLHEPRHGSVQQVVHAFAAFLLRHLWLHLILLERSPPERPPLLAYSFRVALSLLCQGILPRMLVRQVAFLERSVTIDRKFDWSIKGFDSLVLGPAY